MVHFTYKAAPEMGVLRQGDVLDKTDQIREILRTVHPHYLKDDYTHFQVLTQSCDLELRGSGCSSRYITIAAVRSLSLVIARTIAEEVDRPLTIGGVTFANSKYESRLKSVLGQIFNNNHKSYFFLKSCPELNFPEDSCTFLHLSVALKPEHYQTLLTAKRLQLEEVFQSKLGWTVGNLYSRVGTPDYIPHAVSNQQEFDSLIAKTLEGHLGWVDSKRFPALRKCAAQAQGDQKEDISHIMGAVSESIEQEKNKAYKRLAEEARRAAGLSADQAATIEASFKGNAAIRKLLGFE